MSTSGELISPSTFLGIPPARFEHERYLNFQAEHSGIWTVQGELREGAYSQSLELLLHDDGDIITAALYAWYTATVRRNFVYMDFEGEKVVTHYFSEQIQEAARKPEVEVVALRLFGTQEAQAMSVAGMSDHYIVDLQPYDEAEGENLRTARETDRQQVLPWVVAGATAMLNEIVHGTQPDHVWTPSN